MPLFGVPGRLGFVDFAEMATVFLAGYLLPVVCGRARWRLGVVVWYVIASIMNCKSDDVVIWWSWRFLVK